MAGYRRLHEWDLSAAEAVELQKRLRGEVRIEPLASPVATVAGADISFNKYEDTVYAGIVVLRLPGLELVEQAGVVSRARFPYVPGLLSFREIPALLEAWEKLQVKPDLVMLDGQGIAHPRRMGIASHMGLLVERPTVGCAKSLLTGTYEEPATERGEWTPLMSRGETLGAVLRTKRRVQPMFISPGHRITLAESIDLVLRCDGGYRMPEPTRRAHLMVNELRRAAG